MWGTNRGRGVVAGSVYAPTLVSVQCGSSLPGIGVGVRRGGVREEVPPSKGNLHPASGRQRAGREFSPASLILSCLQFKVILRPKWPILGWHILTPCMRTVVGDPSRNAKCHPIRPLRALPHVRPLPTYFHAWPGLFG